MDSTIERFFKELDGRWKPAGHGKIRLDIIGSSAIMLQTAYLRGTKDSDVLKSRGIDSETEKKLTEMAGKGSKLHDQFRIYLDFVNPAIPFLPQKPHFLGVGKLRGLKHFELFALDLTDIAVSKMKRFNANDVSDISALIKGEKVNHNNLVRRFRKAADYYSMDARAEELPRYIKNLHTVERDFFEVGESEIELPPWVGDM